MTETIIEELLRATEQSKEDLIDLILAASAKEDPPGVAAEVRTSNKKSKNLNDDVDILIDLNIIPKIIITQII